MAQPGTIEGRELRKFLESKSRPQHSMVEVSIGNVDELAAALGGGEEVDLADGTVSAVKAIYKTVNGVKLAEDNLGYSEASVIGISVTSALDGERLSYKTIGKLNDSSFNFPVNDQIYLGANGLLTNVAPLIGFRTLIGTSNGLGEIQINIQEPIIL